MPPSSAQGHLPGAVVKIAEHVACIPLPLPLPDLKVVNAYAILASDGITLIDPGWATAESEALLRAGLGALGADVGDVNRTLVTHAHWDHYTQAAKWRDEHGVELMLGTGERHSVESFDVIPGVYPTQAKMLVRAGVPELAREIGALDWAPHEREVPHGPPDRWLNAGDQIDCVGTIVNVRSTPGHTRGHVVYEIAGSDLVFTGDHLLPRITPSLGFERLPEQLPLKSFLGSLQLFLDLPDSRMLPAHGPLGMSTRLRAEELIEHHADRLRRVAELVADGLDTAYVIAERMRWTRHDRSLRELSSVHQMTAILEVRAHLDHLVDQAVIAVDETGSASSFTIR